MKHWMEKGKFDTQTRTNGFCLCTMDGLVFFEGNFGINFDHFNKFFGIISFYFIIVYFCNNVFYSKKNKILFYNSMFQHICIYLMFK